MRFSFRLAELVAHDPDPNRRPGTIKKIVEHTGLDRHQVSSLLKNKVKYIPLDALSRICDYLVKEEIVPADQLPGVLFAIEPENFWELLGRRKCLELCIGVRCGDQEDWANSAWVTASDSVLLGELLNNISTLGGTKGFRRESDGWIGSGAGIDVRTSAGAATGKTPAEADEMQPTAIDVSGTHLEQMIQRLVWSPSQRELGEAVEERAREVYGGYNSAPGDRALVCIGSTKSNPVVELVMADIFGCEPFHPQEAARPTNRQCPVFLRFREIDPHPNSCFGGMQLANSQASNEPGIWYETGGGKWECAPSDGRGRDAALVVYRHRESQGRIEMALAGFSGRATRALARVLAGRSQEFWSSKYDGDGVQIGAFVVRFQFLDEEHLPHDLLRTDLAADAEIIPISPEVIGKRFHGKARREK